MIMLCEIRDGTMHQNIDEDTLIDIDLFRDMTQAVIFAEPEHFRGSGSEIFFIVDNDGVFYKLLPLGPGKLADLVKFKTSPILGLKLLFKHCLLVSELN